MTSIHFPHPREDQAESYSEIMHMSTSIHFPHPREDCHTSSFPPGPGHFNPLPSSEGRQSARIHRVQRKHFNPLPSSEGRLIQVIISEVAELLQSTSLIRGKTSFLRSDRPGFSNFNPLPSSEGRHISPYSHLEK